MSIISVFKIFFAKDLNQLKSIEMNERSLYAKRMFKL
jgi:hypothetical protein